MVAVLETDNRKDSPGTHGAVVGPGAAGGMGHNEYCVPRIPAA